MAYLSLSKASPVQTHFNERGCILVTCYEFQQEENGFVQPFVAYTAAVVVPSNSYYLKKTTETTFQCSFEKHIKVLFMFTHFGRMMFFFFSMILFPVPTTVHALWFK